MKSSRCRPKPRWREAFTLLELLLSLGIVAVLLMIGLPLLSAARERARDIQCKANLRTLASYVHHYAADNDGYFPSGWNPVTRTTWTTYLDPYATGAAINGKIGGKAVREGPFYCPSTRVGGEGIYERDQAGWRTDFGANEDLLPYPASRAGSQGGLSPMMVMFYDGTGVKRNPPLEVKKRARHAGYSNIVFLDGHVESYKDFPTETIYWKGK